MKKTQNSLNMMSAVLNKPSKSMGVSLATEGVRDEINFISIDLIIPYKNQSRTIFFDKSIIELSDSIKSQGIIQPLQVIPSQQNIGKYEVVSGERRLKAAKLVFLDKVPCIILDKKKDSNLVSLIENIQREDLHPVDLANTIGELVENARHGEKSQIALKLGMNPSLFSQYITIFNFPKSVKLELLKNTNLPFYKAFSLSKFNSEEDMISAIKKKLFVKQSISFLRVKSDGDLFSFKIMNKKYLTPEKKKDLKSALLDFIETI